MLHAILVSVLSANLFGAALPPRATRLPLPAAAASLLRPAPPIALADSLVVEKKARTLTVYRDGTPVRTYLIALGASPVGNKVRAGDRRTPEGLFYIDSRQPNSKFHLALHISYPDPTHRARSVALGVDPGGDIMIHGLRSVSTVPAGRTANAPLIGANTVNGPLPCSVPTRSAAFTAATSVV